MTLDIVHTTRELPRGRFRKIAESVLPTSFNATLVFVGEKRAQKLNEETRGKDYIPNVLSFPLSKTEGEIYICPQVCKKEAANFGLSYTHYLEYLTIHGCLHILGYDHGKKMDSLEDKYKKIFQIKNRE